MAIRWDKNYSKNVNRIVRNYNRRLKNLQSYGAQYLPDTTSMQYIRDTFDNRRDLNRYLRQLERFNAKSARIVGVGTDNRRMTLWEKQKLISDRASARAKARFERARILARQPKHLRNFERGERFGQLTAYINKLSKPLSELSYRDVEVNQRITMSYQERAKRERIFKKNFFEMMAKDAIQAGGDPEQVDRIEKALDILTPNQLLQAYDEMPQLKYIFEHYNLYASRNPDAYITDNNKLLVLNELDEIEAMLDIIIKKYANVA